MLGPLLRIGPQLGLERAVLLGRAPAAARARDRAHVDAAVLEAAQDLRRRADQHRPLAAQEEEIGAGIDQPQVPVDRERVDLERDAELLREHHLEDVARLDVLLGALHHLVERLARGAATHVHRRAQRLAGGLLRQRLAQAPGDRIERGDGLAVARAEIVPLRDLHVADQQGRLAHVVVHDDRLRQDEPEIGKIHLVGVRVGKLLDEAHPVVADHADRAAEEGRQGDTRRRHGAQRRELLAQHLERIAAGDRSAACDRLRSTRRRGRARGTPRAPRCR